MKMVSLTTKTLLLFFLSTATALAQSTSIPLMELIFGPTATNAVVGNSGLTVGISKFGEMTSLRWPCSNYYDQLNYKTIHPVPAWNKVEWYDRHLNAKPFSGSYAGIRFKQNNKQVISWLRDADWETTQYYLKQNAPIVCTKYINNKLGITITCTEAVLPTTDVYFRNFKIDFLSDNTISDIQLVYMANLAMCNVLKPFEPNSDWEDDSKNGYITYFDSVHNATVSFTLNKETSLFKKLPSANPINKFIKAVESTYKSVTYSIAKDNPSLNVFCAIGYNQPILENSISKSNQFTITKEKKSNDPIEGPNISLSYLPLALKQNTLVYFSFSDNYITSIDQLNIVKNRNFDELINETVEYWDKKMGAAKIPNVPDEQMRNTLKRILINTLLATNKGNGIGSSIGETQPPYTMIWTRDAAIMGYMLDCAGFTKEAEENVSFIASTQRKEEGQDCRNPKNNECYKGTWSQCYFANGTPSWMYDFEVDEVGWGIWAMYTHSLFLEKSKQVDYLKKYENNIILASDFLVSFKDTNGLQKKAREDDLLWKSQTILGASTSLIGLKSAMAALAMINPEHQKISIYKERKLELEKAIEKEFWNSQRQEFGKAGYGNFGPRGLIVWPAIYLPNADNKMQGQAKAINAQVESFFNKKGSAMNKEWWYLGKTTTAMAFAGEQNNNLNELAKDYLKILLTEVCTPDTYIFGETPMLRKNKQGNLYFDNRVGQPSNHPAAWIYMTAEFLYGNTHPELYR
jgi:GH15 family glucan-1,4-alpha-glucosidase